MPTFLNDDVDFRIDRLRASAASARVSNPVLNTPNAGLATVTVSATAPSFSGFTNLIPATGRFAAAHTFTTTAGSKILTGYAYVSGASLANLSVGMPLCQRTTGAYPANIPPGAVIEAIDTVNNTITMSKPATGSGSAVPVGFWPRGIRLVGGVLGTSGGSSEARETMGTVGNSLTPPTAQNNNIVAPIAEFYTDAANFSTSTPVLIFHVYAGTLTLQKFRLLIDDVPLSLDASDLAAANSNNYISVQLPSAGIDKVRLELSDATSINGIYVVNGASVWNSDAKPKSVMFGDSYFLAGEANSFQPNNLAHQLANLLGWEPYLAAVGGTGYVSDGGSNYAWSNPLRSRDFGIVPADVGVIFGTINDGSASAAAVKAAARTTWEAARALNPSMPLIIFGIPATNTATAGYPTQEQALIEAFAEWGDKNAWFFPITLDRDGIWLSSGNRSRYIAADNNHPSHTGLSSGNRYLASRMAEKIRTFVLGL